MDSTLSDLLRSRERAASRGRVRGTVASTLLHFGVAALFLLGPALAARKNQPLEYTKVQIVPLKALGVANPQPVRRAEPKPPPAKEPDKPAPEPEPRREEPKKVPLPDSRPSSRSTDRPSTADRPEGGPAADRPAQRRGAPDGSPLGLAPFGSNQSGFDDPDFKYSYYTDLLLAIIGSNYLRPAIAVEVEMILHFRVQRDGTLTEVEITTPSGYASFDQAGLSAVRSSTLPPLPVSYPNDSLGVSLIIR